MEPSRILLHWREVFGKVILCPRIYFFLHLFISVLDVCIYLFLFLTVCLLSSIKELQMESSWHFTPPPLCWWYIVIFVFQGLWLCILNMQSRVLLICFVYILWENVFSKRRKNVCLPFPIHSRTTAEQQKPVASLSRHDPTKELTK